MTVTVSKKQREISLEDSSEMNSSTVRPPPRRTDELKEFESGTSGARIQAQVFHKNAEPLSYVLLI